MTDVQDEDVAEVIDGTIRVRVAALEPGASLVVTFLTRAVATPAVSNQAFVDADGLEREPSDDGGDDRDTPTRLEIGEPLERRMDVTKTPGCGHRGPSAHRCHRLSIVG